MESNRSRFICSVQWWSKTPKWMNYNDSWELQGLIRTSVIDSGRERTIPTVSAVSSRFPYTDLVNCRRQLAPDQTVIFYLLFLVRAPCTHVLLQLLSERQSRNVLSLWTNQSVHWFWATKIKYLNGLPQNSGSFWAKNKLRFFDSSDWAECSVDYTCNTFSPQRIEYVAVHVSETWQQF